MGGYNEKGPSVSQEVGPKKTLDLQVLDLDFQPQ
jgi:hypothetical protein